MENNSKEMFLGNSQGQLRPRFDYLVVLHALVFYNLIMFS